MHSSEKKTNSLYFYIWFHHFPSQFDLLWTQEKLWQVGGDSDILSQACVSAVWVVSTRKAEKHSVSEFQTVKKYSDWVK